MFRAVASTISAAFNYLLSTDADAGPLEPRLLKAVSEGDVAKVEKLLAQGADPNALINFNEWATPTTAKTPLPAAAVMHLVSSSGPNALTILPLLLDKGGGDPNVLDEMGCTPLLMAIYDENVRVDYVRLLLERGSKPDIVANDPEMPRTPLMAAVTIKNAEIVRLLLQHGADPNGVTPPGANRDSFFIPLLLASGAAANTDVVTALLDAGADVYAADPDGLSPLHMAAATTNPTFPDGRACADVLRLLLARGADPNKTRNGKVGTPLMGACVYGDTASVEALLDAGADVNAALPPNRESPLLHACMAGKPDIVRVLLARGANARAESTGKNGWQKVTPLHGAAEGGNRDVVKLLLAAPGGGVDIDAVTTAPFTPLTLAIQLGNFDCALELLDAGASVDLLHPIFSAIYRGGEGGALPVVEALVDRKCALAVYGPDGHTPLTLAIAKGSAAIVRLLLERGKVDPNQAKQDGMPPLELAQLEGFEEIVELLKASGAVEL
ncbi:ankyrin repeat-containing domain protein [Zopfochytrium polystomum]|nr:ankyrin repeat-containing domain protein [Zopfochytrium polystomum]